MKITNNNNSNFPVASIQAVLDNFKEKSGLPMVFHKIQNIE